MTGLHIKGMLDLKFFIKQAHNNTGHEGWNKTYHNVTDKCLWQNSFSLDNKFVEFCEIGQAIKSSTQKPVGLLTSLAVLQRSWIEIAMDFSFL